MDCLTFKEIEHIVLQIAAYSTFVVKALQLIISRIPIKKMLTSQMRLHSITKFLTRSFVDMCVLVSGSVLLVLLWPTLDTVWPFLVVVALFMYSSGRFISKSIKQLLSDFDNIERQTWGAE